MSLVKVSKLLPAALAGALGLLPVAPPEHVHEGEDHGHLHLLVHRHQNSHGFLEHHPPIARMDDDDGPAFTLTTVYSVPAPPAVAAPPQVAVEWIQPPAPRRIERPYADVEILIHGPPRAPTPPRAPPFLSPA